MIPDFAYPSQGAFAPRLRERARAINSWLCIGLDPDRGLLPSGVSRDAASVARFCASIVEATQDSAVAFKINFAFFEVLGPAGWTALSHVRRAMPPEIPVIADAKRGDIGNTAAAYAEAILDVLDFDAVTVSPYLGWDALEPFTRYEGRGVLVLCKTSNPGASELQDVDVGGEPLYMRVARTSLSLVQPAEIGLVIGATQPDALRAVRTLSQDAVFLVPGVGAQGASAADAIRLAANRDGENALISVSRQIIHASRDPDYASAAAESARRFASQTRLQPEVRPGDR